MFYNNEYDEYVYSTNHKLPTVLILICFDSILILCGLIYSSSCLCCSRRTLHKAIIGLIQMKPNQEIPVCMLLELCCMEEFNVLPTLHCVVRMTSNITRVYDVMRCHGMTRGTPSKTVRYCKREKAWFIKIRPSLFCNILPSYLEFDIVNVIWSPHIELCSEQCHTRQQKATGCVIMYEEAFLLTVGKFKYMPSCCAHLINRLMCFKITHILFNGCVTPCEWLAVY